MVNFSGVYKLYPGTERLDSELATVVCGEGCDLRVATVDGRRSPVWGDPYFQTTASGKIVFKLLPGEHTFTGRCHSKEHAATTASDGTFIVSVEAGTHLLQTTITRHGDVVRDNAGRRTFLGTCAVSAVKQPGVSAEQ